MSTSSRMYIARSGASATTSVAVATAAATAKTVVAVMGTAGTTIAVKRIRVSFASVTATDVPALVEVGVITALGTGTSFTPVQHAGSTMASACSAAYNHTVEPTYNRITEVTHVPAQQGLYEFWFPLGEELQCDPSQGLAIRVTSPQAQSVFASILYSE